MRSYSNSKSSSKSSSSSTLYPSTSSSSSAISNNDFGHYHSILISSTTSNDIFPNSQNQMSIEKELSSDKSSESTQVKKGCKRKLIFPPKMPPLILSPLTPRDFGNDDNMDSYRYKPKYSRSLLDLRQDTNHTINANSFKTSENNLQSSNSSFSDSSVITSDQNNNIFNPSSSISLNPSSLDASSSMTTSSFLNSTSRVTDSYSLANQNNNTPISVPLSILINAAINSPYSLGTSRATSPLFNDGSKAEINDNNSITSLSSENLSTSYTNSPHICSSTSSSSRIVSPVFTLSTPNALASLVKALDEISPEPQKR